MADTKLSQLPSTDALALTALILLSTPDTSDPTLLVSKKIVATDLANSLLNFFEYTQELTTQTKTIIGAINEIKADAGASIDDTTTSTASTWSSSKITSEDAAVAAAARTLVISMLPTDTATGAVASFPDGADNVPVVDAVAQIVASQAGTGDPSPSNPRTISGYTGMKIFKMGSNLCGGEFLLDNLQSYMPTGTTDTTNKTFAFSASASTTAGESLTMGVKFKELTSYTIILSVSKSNTGAATNLRVYYTDNTYENLTLSGTITANTKYTHVQTTNPEKTVRTIVKTNSSGTTTLYYDEFGLFEGTKVAEDFVAYNGSTTVIDWTDEAGTVYGGSLDLKTGLLTVTHLFIDLTELDWTKDYNQTNPNGTYYTSTGDFSNVGAYDTIKSNVGVPGNGNIPTSPANSFWFNAARTEIRWIWGSPNGGSTYQDLKNYIDNNEAYLIVAFVTPITYQLDPVTLSTFKGVNNIWSDTGDMSIEYRTDIGLYIDKKTQSGNRSAPLSASLTKSESEEKTEEKTEEETEGGNDER